jgi:hypothetical protein
VRRILIKIVIGRVIKIIDDDGSTKSNKISDRQLCTKNKNIKLARSDILYYMLSRVNIGCSMFDRHVKLSQ